MTNLDLLSQTHWQPLKAFGVTHSFFNIHATTMINSWLVLGIILLFGLSVRFILSRKQSVLRFLVVSFVQAFEQLVEQTLGFFSLTHFSFVTSLFTFIALCTIISLIPGTSEPTKDLNTTLALALISFCYIQFFAIKVHGLWHYIKDYFLPIFIMLPLNLIGKVAIIISMSFRLFGNTFGGATIGEIYFGLIDQAPLWVNALVRLSGINLVIVLFFGLFEGFIQAFVFAMLSLTYLSNAITYESAEQHEGIP